MPHIIQNAIRLPNGEFLVSSNRHDYVSKRLPNGHTVAVDGGLDYLRRVYGSPTDFLEYGLHSTDSVETVKSKLLWGTRGKSGRAKLKYKRLIDLETPHLKAILAIDGINPLHRATIRVILQERGEQDAVHAWEEI